MAETLVEKKVCRECGVDVRPQTLFCYNCGKSVTETPDAEPPAEPSSVWFGETIAADEPEPETVPPEEDPSDAVTESWEGPLAAELEPEPETPEQEHGTDETEVLEPESTPVADDIDPIHHSLPVESELRSAASIRRKPKTFHQREVEVVWEEYEGGSGLKYVLITLFVVLFTIIVYWIAMTMK